MIAIRSVITAIGVIAALFWSPWITALCIVALAFRYRSIEAVALGALLDMLWLPHDSWFTMFPLCTLASLVIVWGLEPLRLEFLR